MAAAKLAPAPAQTQGQQGYTIVEALIVLVVIGMLLGTSLYPLGQRLRVEKIEKTQEQLLSIRDAVLGYAYSNRTSRVGIRYGGAGDIAVVPQGRPFLPCPDVTGDGVEDRWPGNPALLEIQNYRRDQYVDYFWDTSNVGGTLLRQMRSSPEILLNFQLTISATRADNPLLPESNEPIFVCLSDRGNVPWTTLGTPPSDPWGNRFSYRVDPIFSHGVLGFGLESRSDVFDPRLPLTTTVSGGISLTVYQRRDTDSSHQVVASLTLAASSVTVTTNHNDSPGVVCITLAGSSIPCLNTSDGGKAGNSDDAYANYVNSVARASLTVFDSSLIATVARPYDPEEFFTGVAFVVLSHGANAVGAVVHEEGRNTLHGTSQSGLKCIATSTFPATYSNDRPEDENADSIDLCTANFPTGLRRTATPRTHSFISLPVFNSGEDDIRFDDVIFYMSDVEVIQSMARLGIKLDNIYHPPGP